MSTLGGGSFLDVLLGGIKRVLRNGTPLPVRPAINLIGFQAVLDNPSLGATDIFAPSGGGSGGGSLLIIQNNGSPLPVEPSLNFVGFTVADNPGSTRTDVTRPGSQSPPATITTTASVSTAAPWVLFQAMTGGYTITLTTIVASVPILIQWIRGGTSTLSIDNVTLSRGSNTFQIENPQDRSLALQNSVPLETDNQTYEYMLDATNNVLRCMRQVR